MSAKIDPITRSVVQHRLSSIVKEMGEAMLRTSYSQILNSSRDFSLAICDTDGRLIAQADHLPVHVGALPWATLAVEERFKDVKPGDVILLNDPYHGGSHLPDLTAFVPVFAGDKRLLWTIVRAHQSDIGGATHGAYNPAATEIWQEGLRVPPIKLYEAGKLRDDLLDLLALNIRNPREFRGDLAAMLGAAHLGERRAVEIVQPNSARRWSKPRSRRSSMRRSSRPAPWSRPGRTACSTARRFSTMTAMAAPTSASPRRSPRRAATSRSICRDSDPQSTSFVNSSHANMQAAVAMAFAYLIDAEIPKNTGALRPLKVIAKQGTMVWADPGRPVTLCTSHPSNEIVEAIVKALSASCPERAMAGWSRRFRIAIQGEDPRTGKNFIWHLFQARPGGGASSGGDGWSSIGEWHSVGGLKFGSLEVAEVRFPLHFRQHEFRPGSGGDGQYRGGLGVSLDLVLETEKIAKGNTAGDGARHGPCGMLGGEDGKPHHYRLLSEGREPRVLRTKEVGIELRPGDCLEIRSSGGGGWGPPEKRSAEARRRDREQGLTDVAAEQASS